MKQKLTDNQKIKYQIVVKIGGVEYPSAYAMHHHTAKTIAEYIKLAFPNFTVSLKQVPNENE